MNEKKFKDLTKIDFKEFGDSLRYVLKDISSNPDFKKPKFFDKIKENSFFKEISKLGKKLELMPGDLAKISSWGINNSGNSSNSFPILIDSGLTKDIYNAFYD